MVPISRTRSLSILLLLTLLLLFSTLSHSASLLVHFIDVGQGDAILIESCEATLLIDGGRGSELLSYLQEIGVEALDLIISTHPHADHIGGLIPVLEEIPVGRIYDSGRPHTTQTFFNFLTLIDELDIPYTVPSRGDMIGVGDLELEVLHPVDDVEYGNLNDSSIVVRLVYHEISFLFTGDIEEEAEKDLLSTCMNKATILKVAHHGSSTSTGEEFIDVINPEVAIISCGRDNRYGHPHREILKLLEGKQIQLYRTDLHGHILLSTDGETYHIETSREMAKEDLHEEKMVDINTASSYELQRLHGIGEVIAQRIIQYREENGGFKHIEELKKVWGIGDARFEEIKDNIRVD